jgi:flagellar assembly factor FliW
MLIETTRFGRIEVAEGAILQFPRGLYGLDDIHAYCLLEHDNLGLFAWLQAVDAPSIAMVVTDPFRFFPDYEVEIPDPAAELLGAASAGEVSIYTTIAVAADRRQLYTNLLGPLVINPSNGRGVQLVLDSNRYSSRHPVPLPGPGSSSEPEPDRAGSAGPVLSLASV